MERRRMVDGGSVIIKIRRRGEERREKLENYITSYKPNNKQEPNGSAGYILIVYVSYLYFII